ncbi:hypothetical protein [Ktedonospora formicarum]|uniref:Uncharacterized protein n=1 Tax=Ktedonospora formicarum TaxID=2778364 RepID=A0A8J3IAD7_9CHLR|nr:hypothetical protein [Ktedonospora formicarum]GHO48648.1 hypothetical protein KSX_68110 [Ktedonospora formicarum]
MGDLHLSSWHYAGSRVADAEVIDAHGHVLMRQERLAITARRLLFEHLQRSVEDAREPLPVTNVHEKGN